jgi:hypothetical protein
MINVPLQCILRRSLAAHHLLVVSYCVLIAVMVETSNDRSQMVYVTLLAIGKTRVYLLQLDAD